MENIALQCRRILAVFKDIKNAHDISKCALNTYRVLDYFKFEYSDSRVLFCCGALRVGIFLIQVFIKCLSQ